MGYEVIWKMRSRARLEPSRHNDGEVGKDSFAAGQFRGLDLKMLIKWDDRRITRQFLETNPYDIKNESPPTNGYFFHRRWDKWYSEDLRTCISRFLRPQLKRLFSYQKDKLQFIVYSIDIQKYFTCSQEQVYPYHYKQKERKIWKLTPEN